MSRFTAWIALLILIGSVWSQEYSREEFKERSPRFGFDLLDPIRKSFCNSACGSTEKSPYLTNLACALKCPELYLPHGSTTREPITFTWTPSTTSSSTSPSTTSTSTSPSSTSPSSTSPSSTSSSSSTSPSSTSSSSTSSSSSTAASSTEASTTTTTTSTTM